MGPLISELERKYTTQYLLSAVRLPVGNANNLYLLLREKVSSGQKRYFDIEFDALRDVLSIQDISRYSSYQHFHNDFFKRSTKQIIEKTEFTNLEIEILNRAKRRANLLRISYEYEDFKVSFNQKEQELAERKMASAVYPASSGPSKRALEMMKEIEDLKNK
jgi:hypothetical protein